MLSTNVVIPKDPEQLALTVNGKKQNIRRKRFSDFARTIGLNKNLLKMIAKITKLKDKYIVMCNESYMPDDMKRCLCRLLRKELKYWQDNL